MAADACLDNFDKQGLGLNNMKMNIRQSAYRIQLLILKKCWLTGGAPARYNEFDIFFYNTKLGP